MIKVAEKEAKKASPTDLAESFYRKKGYKVIDLTPKGGAEPAPEAIRNLIHAGAPSLYVTKGNKGQFVEAKRITISQLLSPSQKFWLAQHPEQPTTMFISVVKTELRTLHACLRCGHEWLDRRGSTPRICPKCKSRKWQEPKRAPRKAPREMGPRHGAKTEGEVT